MRWTLLCVLGVLVTAPVGAQPYQDVSRLPYDSRFDFLIGSWTYETTNAHGSATYVKSPATGIITERIDGAFGTQRFVGLSMFMFDCADSETVHQKWFDSLGNSFAPVITLQAYEPADTLVPIAEFVHQGRHFRHVWFEITEDRFLTDLLVMNEDGVYALVRRMPYVRM